MKFPKSLPLAMALIALALPTVASEETVVLFPPDLALSKEGKINVFAFSPTGSAVPVSVNGTAIGPLGGDRLKGGKVELRPGMNTVDVGGVRLRVYSDPAGLDRQYVFPENESIPLVVQAYRVHPAMDDGCDGCHTLEGGKLKAKNQKESCYACHDNFEKGTGGGRHVHTPVAAGECTGCHDPHFSTRPKLQKLEKGCFECHDPPQAAESVHYPVSAGECIGCHSPHAGPYPMQITRAGNRLCLECHASPHSHHPFGPAANQRVTTRIPPDIPRNSDQFSCLACHLPHRSSERRLLSKKQGDLCKTCHPV